MNPEFGWYAPAPRRRTLLFGAMLAFSAGIVTGFVYPDRPRLTVTKIQPVALACWPAAPAAAAGIIPTLQDERPAMLCHGEIAR
jgi:hypothetical protein